MKAYRITQWDEAHETHESRKLTYMAWVAIPNKHDGLGFSHLRSNQDRVELYCAWTLMVQLASKARKGVRGWLVRGDRPLTSLDMAMMTGFPQQIFDKALKFFSNADVAWMALEEPENTPSHAAAVPAGHAGPPASAAAVPAGHAGPPASAAAFLPTDRQTDRQTDSIRERENGAAGDFQKQKLQAGLLIQRIAALEKELKAETEPQPKAQIRFELQKKRVELEKIQKKQAAGNFEPTQTP